MKKTLLMLLALGMGACEPTVKIEAPDKPITSNLNVNITQEVRVKVDRDLDKKIFSKNSNLF